MVPQWTEADELLASLSEGEFELIDELRRRGYSAKKIAKIIHKRYDRVLKFIREYIDPEIRYERERLAEELKESRERQNTELFSNQVYKQSYFPVFIEQYKPKSPIQEQIEYLEEIKGLQDSLIGLWLNYWQLQQLEKVLKSLSGG